MAEHRIVAQYFKRGQSDWSTPLIPKLVVAFLLNLVSARWFLFSSIAFGILLLACTPRIHNTSDSRLPDYLADSRPAEDAYTFSGWITKPHEPP
jgi:hypothetical protein